MAMVPVIIQANNAWQANDGARQIAFQSRVEGILMYRDYGIATGDGGWPVGAAVVTGSSSSITSNTWMAWDNVYQTQQMWRGWIRTEPRQDGVVMNQVVNIPRPAIIDANVCAEKLLKSLLSSDQRRQYEADRTFEVITTKSGRNARRYKVTHGWAGNVFLLDENGREVERLCIHPDAQVPVADNLVAQKLLLESDEAEFRRIANRSIRSADGPWLPAGRAA